MSAGGWITGASLTSTEPVHTDPNGVIGHLGTLRRFCSVVQASIAQQDLTERIVTEFIDECTRTAVALSRLFDTPESGGDPRLAAAAQALHNATAIDQPQEETCSATESGPPKSRWKSADPAMGLDSRRDIRTVLPVEESDRSLSASSNCDRCEDTGVMRWQQPVPDGKGGMILREEEVPCPRGCGGHWKHPAAESDRVIGAPGETPTRRRGGNAAAANKGGVGFFAAIMTDPTLDVPQEPWKPNES